MKKFNWRGWVLPLLLIGLWEYTSHRDATHAYAFAPLETVWAALREVLGNGELWENLRGSLLRTSTGLALGVLAGVAVGVLMAFSRVALTLINPLYQSLRQVPLLGLTPLISLWLGNGEGAKLFVIALAAFYPMVLNTYEGLHQVDGRYREVGRVYGFGRWALLRRVYLPAALPSLLTGLQQAVPFAWISAVGAELLLNAGAGLGNLMMTAEMGARMDLLIVCTVAVSLLGIGMSYLVGLLARYSSRWQRVGEAAV